MENKELTPTQYFEQVKDKKQNITDEELSKIYDNCLELLSKYKITGQIKGMKKIIFHLDCIEKEREIVKLGINTFVYRDDIEEYIDSIAKDTVKIIELENYEREIPDEVVGIVGKVKDKFDQLYVVFTDYTGKVERQIEQERREKDPILFGTFQNKENRSVIDRFYYLADWQDEYCDLTLDKMVNQFEKVGNRNIVNKISTPSDINELKKQLDKLESNKDTFVMTNTSKNKGLFKNIKTFFFGE